VNRLMCLGRVHKVPPKRHMRPQDTGSIRVQTRVRLQRLLRVYEGGRALGDRWSLVIVREPLLRGTLGFNGIAEGRPGISRPVVATRLRKLEDLGVDRAARGAAEQMCYLVRSQRRGGGTLEPSPRSAPSWHSF
jgi:HxlR-like helix-turn-helix